MLLQFSANNFASFKDELVLTLVPSSDNDHKENVFTEGKFSVLKNVALYGANASGKSNVIKAITTALLIIRNSNTIQPGQPIPLINPFAFDSSSSKRPTAFEFQFVVDDVKHIYGFSATMSSIVEEYLYSYYSAKPTKIFDRKNGKIEYTSTEESALKPLMGKTADNKLFITTANGFNYPKVKPAFDWLSRMIDTYNFDLQDSSVLKAIYDDRTGKYKKFTLDLLHAADINIDDFIIDRTTIPQGASGNFPIAPFSYVNFNPVAESYIYQAIMIHKVNEKGEIKEYKLPLGSESLGTQLLFQMSSKVKEALEQGKVMVVDELEKSLHPFLVKYLIDQFRDSASNTKGGQLIFTTHDTNLLNLDFFRRDQIWFTEKNNETGISELYSLNEYSVRKDENIQKGYLLGRYGAIPYIHTEELL